MLADQGKDLGGTDGSLALGWDGRFDSVQGDPYHEVVSVGSRIRVFVGRKVRLVLLLVFEWWVWQ